MRASIEGDDAIGLRRRGCDARLAKQKSQSSHGRGQACAEVLRDAMRTHEGQLRPESMAFEKGPPERPYVVGGEAPGLDPGSPLRLRGVAFCQSRFYPGEDLGLKISHPAHSVRAQPYPLRELACLFETVKMGVAVENEFLHLFF